MFDRQVRVRVSDNTMAVRAIQSMNILNVPKVIQSMIMSYQDMQTFVSILTTCHTWYSIGQLSSSFPLCMTLDCRSMMRNKGDVPWPCHPRLPSFMTIRSQEITWTYMGDLEYKQLFVPWIRSNTMVRRLCIQRCGGGAKYDHIVEQMKDLMNELVQSPGLCNRLEHLQFRELNDQSSHMSPSIALQLSKFIALQSIQITSMYNYESTEEEDGATVIDMIPFLPPSLQQFHTLNWIEPNNSLAIIYALIACECNITDLGLKLEVQGHELCTLGVSLPLMNSLYLRCIYDFHISSPVVTTATTATPWFKHLTTLSTESSGRQDSGRYFKNDDNLVPLEQWIPTHDQKIGFALRMSQEMPFLHTLDLGQTCVMDMSAFATLVHLRTLKFKLCDHPLEHNMEEHKNLLAITPPSLSSSSSSNEETTFTSPYSLSFELCRSRINTILQSLAHVTQLVSLSMQTTQKINGCNRFFDLPPMNLSPLATLTRLERLELFGIPISVACLPPSLSRISTLLYTIVIYLSNLEEEEKEDDDDEDDEEDDADKKAMYDIRINNKMFTHVIHGVPTTTMDQFPFLYDTRDSPLLRSRFPLLTTLSIDHIRAASFDM